MEFPPTAIIRESLHSRFDTTLSRLEARTCHSWKMALDRSQLLPLTTDIGGQACPQIFIQSADGCHVTDIDGNAYVDLCMGFGTNLLGHSPAVVEQAITEQVKKGWNYGLRGEGQLAFADLIRQAGPANERVLLCASGTEATALAIRAARAFTKKDAIGVFGGSYHGAHDYALVVASPTDDNAKAHVGTGVPVAVDTVVEPLPYGDADAFERIRRLRHRLAAVIVEPVQSSHPTSDHIPWLKELEHVCRDNDVLLILDEVMTGFRLAYGGGQTLFEVKPDLVTYGKALAGGLPVGAVAGPASIMRMFTPDSRGISIFAGSAFAGNPLTCAAGQATLTFLKDHGKTFYADLNGTTDRLVTQVNTYWAESDVPLRLLSFGSMMRLICQREQVTRAADINASLRHALEVFVVHVLDHGVTVHASHRAFLSAAHTNDDVDFVANALIGATEQTLADGLFRDR